MSEWSWVLDIAGFAFIFVIAIISLILVCEGIRDLISTIVWQWKYKHRFNKKPIAQCYCKDCIYRTEDGRCCDTHTVNEYHFADDFFCKYAVPCKKDPEKGKKKK